MNSYFGTPLGEKWPGADEGIARMKTHEATAASWWLKWAAIFCVLRAAAVPWYVRYFGDPLSKTQPDNVSIVKSSLICLAIFAFASIAARYIPVFACFIAMIGFSAVCWTDFHQTKDLFEAGLLSKMLFFGIIVWATMNAIFAKTL